MKEEVDRMNVEKTIVIRLQPAEGMRLKETATGDVFEGEIYLAKSLKPSDFEEITEEEYRAAVTAATEVATSKERIDAKGDE